MKVIASCNPEIFPLLKNVPSCVVVRLDLVIAKVVKAFSEASSPA